MLKEENHEKAKRTFQNIFWKIQKYSEYDAGFIFCVNGNRGSYLFGDRYEFYKEDNL